MTTSYLTGQPEFTSLWNAHEDARLAFHDASEADMEATDKAQWEALETTMGEAYTALMDFIDAHTTQKAAPAVASDTQDAPLHFKSLGSDTGIESEQAFDTAVAAYDVASNKVTLAADMEFSDDPQEAAQYKALEDALSEAHAHLIEVIEGYAAYCAGKALERAGLLHKLAPEAPSTPNGSAPKLSDVFQHIQELDAALKTPAADNGTDAAPEVEYTRHPGYVGRAQHLYRAHIFDVQQIVQDAIESGASELTLTLSLPDNAPDVPRKRIAVDYTARLPISHGFQVVQATCGGDLFYPLHTAPTWQDALDWLQAQEEPLPEDYVWQILGTDASGMNTYDSNLLTWNATGTDTPPQVRRPAQDTPDAS